MARMTNKEKVHAFLNNPHTQQLIASGDLPDPFANYRAFAREAQALFGPEYLPGTEPACANNVREWCEAQENKDRVRYIAAQDVEDAILWRDRKTQIAFVVSAVRAAVAEAFPLPWKESETPTMDFDGPEDAPSPLVVVNLTDLHVGEGEDIDAQIAEYKAIITRALQNGGQQSKEVLLLIGGDLFHYDTPDRTTTKGTILQNGAPGTFYQHLQKTAEFMLWLAEEADRHFSRVAIRFVPGNHDEMTFVALAAGVQQAIEMYAQTEWCRCSFDIAPCDARASFEWKGHLIVADHCYSIKPEKLARIMPVEHPEAWGRTQYRYIFTGHTHRTQVEDLDGGVMLMRGTTMVEGASVWERKNGYVGNRAGLTVTYLEPYSGEYTVRLFQKKG